jgi:hypothetical protein
LKFDGVADDKKGRVTLLNDQATPVWAVLPKASKSDFIRLAFKTRERKSTFVETDQSFIDAGKGKTARRSRSVLEQLEMHIMSSEDSTQRAALVEDLARLEQTARAATPANPVRVTHMTSPSAKAVEVKPLHEGSRFMMAVFEEGSTFVQQAQSGRNQKFSMRARIAGKGLDNYLSRKPEYATVPKGIVAKAAYARYLSDNKHRNSVLLYDEFDNPMTHKDGKEVFFRVQSPKKFTEMMREIGVRAFE